MFEGSQGVNTAGAFTTCVHISQTADIRPKYCAFPSNLPFPPASARQASKLQRLAAQPLHRRAGSQHRPLDYGRLVSASQNNVTARGTRDQGRWPEASSCELLLKPPASESYTASQTNTAPPAPTTTPPTASATRRLLLIRLACDSYAPHSSPGIPHEQPQHVFC